MPILAVVCVMHDFVLWLHAFLHLQGYHLGQLLPLICGMEPCQQDNRHAAKGAIALGTMLHLQPSTLVNKTLVLWSMLMPCVMQTLSVRWGQSVNSTYCVTAEVSAIQLVIQQNTNV